MEHNTSTNHFSKWPEIFSECLCHRSKIWKSCVGRDTVHMEWF